MGWKSSFIIIDSDKDVDQIKLLNELGFNNLREIEKATFEVAIHPENDKIFIGKYKNNLLICAQDLPMSFLEESTSEGEKVLANYFPDTEICSLVLHSVVNLWGYSISKNNEKIRVKAGSSDDGTIVEYGSPLKQELNLLAKAKVNEQGKRQYYFEEFPGEPFEEDQVGENFVFEIASRYLEQNLDRADDLLFETELTGYEIDSSSTKIKEQQTEGVKPNKWLKYGIIIVLLIIWQILKRTF